MIELVDITQHYGIRPVLRNLNLKVEKGDLVALIGPNGMGKTTLLGVMAGVLCPQKGYVEIDGLRRRRSAEEELAIRKRVVFLPDHPFLPKLRTGRELLLAVGKLYDIETERLFDHIERLLRLFQLESKGDSPIQSYSNGEQKKIAVCSALVTEAPVMLLDEPFSGGLDPSGLLALRRVLQQLAERKHVTVVISAPVPELLEGLAKKVAVLRDGKIAAYGTIDDLRKATGCSGTLAEMLEDFFHPQLGDTISKYLEGQGT